MATENLQGKTFQSVLKDWVCDLPLREQGTLLTAIRGCDLTPKFPLDSIERTLTAFIRCAVMNPFDEREIDREVGCFMQTKLPENWKASTFGHYPLHYVMHLVHALEIIAYRCPTANFSAQALYAYNKFVESFHLNPETKIEMKERLGEDRILKASVVE
jgi:hypothetical protein